MNQEVRERFNMHLRDAKNYLKEIQKGLKRVEAKKKGRLNWGNVGDMAHYAEALREAKIDIYNEEE